MGTHVLGGGDGLAVYANDRDTWASVDGWCWQPLVPDGPLVPSEQAVRDIAVGNGVVVLVGGRTDGFGQVPLQFATIDTAVPLP